MIDKNYNKEPKIFKLIIIKKFYSSSCWNKSCITYNLLDKKCLFMTKGFPDKILKNYISKIIKNIDKIISKLIKEGYKIISFATKEIQLNQVDKNKKEDYYMKDLNFVGFIIIENNFKKEVAKVIDSLKKMNSNNSICSIISTNNNVYNAIEGGLKNGIINKKNVYVFDIGEGENEGIIVFSKFLFDKNEEYYHNELEIKTRSIESKKTFVKSNYEEKYSQNNLINNSKEKSTFNDEMTNSFQSPDSLRKMINTSDINHPEIIENSLKNSIKKEEFKTQKTEESSNIFHFPYKRAISKRLSKFFTKNNTSLISTQIRQFNFNEGDSELSSNNINRKQIRVMKTDELINITNSWKNSKDEEYENNFNLSQYLSKNKKRRITATNKKKSILLRNNFMYNYDYLCFRKYEYEIKSFKHECIICFSGKLLEYIYNLKENFDNNKVTDELGNEKYKLDILFTLLKYKVKIFFSMSPNEKSILIKIYRKYFNKAVCMIGNSICDIESIVLSNIGIMIGNQKNFNTLFSHYYIGDKDLMKIEKILKNGRSYYENISNLLSVNSVYTICSIILIIFTYKLNSRITTIRYIFLDSSVFFLCLSAFSVTPDYSINSNNLILNNKVFYIYNIIKMIGTVIIKGIGHTILWTSFENNEDNSQKKNEEILITYLYVFTWGQIVSIIFAFNTQSFYRKHILNNIFFIFIFFLLLEYFLICLTLSDVSVENYSLNFLVTFEYNKDNVDAFEDNHKIMILYLFLGDLFANYLYIKILRIIFEKYANKDKKKKFN